MTLLPWQFDQWQQLYQYKNQNRIPQALLISGANGLGKLNLAEKFAYSLLCLKPNDNGINCGNCAPCILIEAESHPDFIRITTEEFGKAIAIGQIRNLLTQLTLKRQFDTHRVVIIHPAEQLNNSSANAFLKCLEEPSEKTSIILVSNNPSNIPATILSRCQRINIPQPDQKKVIDWLIIQNPKLSITEAESLYHITQRSPFQALEFSNNEMLPLRNECFNAWLEIARLAQHPIVIAGNWHKLQSSPIINWITTWIADIIKCNYQTNSRTLHNPDLQKSLIYLATKTRLKDIFELYDLVLLSKQRADTQINKQSILEEILIKWHSLNQHQN